MVENRIDGASDRSGPGDLAVDIGLNKLDNFNRSSNNKSVQRDESRSNLTRSNIGAQSMQKLTGAASRAQLMPQADMLNEIQRLESRIDTLETKIATTEHSLISKVSDRLSATLPYGAQIQKLEQTIGIIVQTLQAEILQKVTTLLTQNIEVLLPDIPKMRQSMTAVQAEAAEQKTGSNKAFLLAKEAAEGVDELKGEFEYMKTRFSPQFVQRVDKALTSLTTLAYDVEVVKMTASHAAMKKDLDMVEQRLQQYVLMPKFIELQHQCMDYASNKEITRINEESEKTRLMLAKFVLKIDFIEKFKKTESDIWQELETKMVKKDFDRQFEILEKNAEEEKKKVGKEISAIREMCERMRRKQEEALHGLIEAKSEIDDKMSAKEGQKIWANFRKYAQYDELKELYKKTLPAISTFEDKLREHKDHNDKIDLMMRRLDEVLCLKADKDNLKEFRHQVETQFITRAENEKSIKNTTEAIAIFTGKVTEVEEIVKFQARQLQKEMFSAVRRIFIQHQSKEENQPVSMATVLAEMKSVVDVKADKTAIESIVNEKANKVDTEMCLRWVDLLHKMVNKVVLLLTTKLKTDLETGAETQNQRQNKKVQLLQQGLIISKWIESFDSQNINDFYFQTEKEKQPQKIQQVQMQFKRAIEDIERTSLSPNLVEINKHLKKTKDMLDLRQDDSKQFAITMAQNSPKRLRLGVISGERFDQDFDAEKMMHTEKADRYLFAKTSRGEISGKHPPKLSPRRTGGSVDPLVRKANLLSKQPIKSPGSFGPIVQNAFSSQKKSATQLNGSQDESRMTSKYAAYDVTGTASPEMEFNKGGDRASISKKRSSLKPDASQRDSKLSSSRRSPLEKKQQAELTQSLASGAHTPISQRKGSMLPNINQFY